MSPVENIPHNDAYIRTQIRLRVLPVRPQYLIFLYYNNTCSIPSRYYLQLIGTDLSPAYIHN